MESFVFWCVFEEECADIFLRIAMATDKFYIVAATLSGWGGFFVDELDRVNASVPLQHEV
ncbi:MAG: hypothetical protein HHJ12_02885 [Glaciimonas sp.]|nr:hypothetical protein [Glaciimonas sp.]